MKKTPVSKKAVAMGCKLTLALALAVISGVPARAQETPTLVKHVLNGTYYDASSTGVNVSCSTQNCVATANIYTESIPCPGATGVKCTYEVSVAAWTGLPMGWTGSYQFLVDGAVPTGGGTDQNGFYTWGTEGIGMYIATWSVTSQVKNASANQPHSIVVNLGCSAGPYGSTCNAYTGLASLTVRVLKP